MANDLQSKLGEGLSKFQGGIEQGKQKLQVAQEISKFKKSISESSMKKSKVLIEMGQVTYGKLRNGHIKDEELMNLSQELIELDRAIYTATNRIVELSKTNQNGIACSCGTVNGISDKFCGGCGKKVETESKLDSSTALTCGYCEANVPSEANFCPCCGSRAKHS